MLDTLHDLPEEFIVDIHGSSLDDLLYPALAGEALVGFRIGTDHFQQLLRSYKVVQHHYLFRQLRDVFFRISHACHFALKQLVHYYDESVGGLERNARSFTVIILIPIRVKVSFVTVTVLLGDFDEFVAIRCPSVFSIPLTLEEVVFLEGE